jgi:hypothetical protein
LALCLLSLSFESMALVLALYLLSRDEFGKSRLEVVGFNSNLSAGARKGSILLKTGCQVLNA